jgi:hypothetical protein
MKIKWNIETGYVQRIPDWTFDVPDEDLEGLDEREQQAVIEEYVQAEFENNIAYRWWPA